MIKLLYIGNNLSKRTKYPTVLENLSIGLQNEGVKVSVSSSCQNQFVRLIDMCFSVIKNKNTDYILIDTYSTKNFYYALCVSQLARLFKIKYIPILHGGNLPYRLKNNSKFSRVIFNNSYKNIAPSNYLSTSFKGYGFTCEIIPNSIKISDYKFLYRQEIRPKFLWVRNIKSLYNPLLAIKIFIEIKQSYIDAELCMVGPITDSKLYNDCLKLLDSYNLTDSVKFTNSLSKKEWHKLSEQYDIFLNTTNFDNTPVSVIEAMALGLTVVSTNVGGISYLLEDKIDAFLFEKGNENEAVSIIKGILTDNNVKTSLSARKKIMNFDETQVIKQWMNILK